MQYRLWIPLLLLLAAFSGLVGCQAPTPAARFIQQADRLQTEAFASTRVADSDLAEYVQDLGDRIAEAARTVAPKGVDPNFLARVRCELVTSASINAFSTGGTHIYVTNALFQECETEEELAAAIAHAYAHLINLDLEATKMQPDAGVPLSMVAWQFVLNRYTREQERRADSVGLALYSQAGWDPAQFPILFQRMEAISAGHVAPDRESLPSRAFVLQAAATDAKRPARKVLPVADPRTFVSLRQRAAQFHEPKVLTNAHIYLRAIPNCILSDDTPMQKEAQEELKPVPPPPHRIEPN